jgi:hypothetical protein
MLVDIDQARKQQPVGRVVENRRPAAADAGTAFDARELPTLDNDRAPVRHTIGIHNRCILEDDPHCR